MQSKGMYDLWQVPYTISAAGMFLWGTKDRRNNKWSVTAEAFIILQAWKLPVILYFLSESRSCYLSIGVNNEHVPQNVWT